MRESSENKFKGRDGYWHERMSKQNEPIRFFQVVVIAVCGALFLVVIATALYVIKWSPW